jgi:WD40 repeat protein
MFSPNASVLAACDASGVLRFWDPATGTELAAAIGTRDAQVMSFVFASGGKTVITWNSTDRSLPLFATDLRRWDVDTTEELGRTVLPATLSLAFSPDGERVAMATDDSLVLLNLRDGSTDAPHGPKWGSVERLAFSPAGNHLIACQAGGEVRIWNLEDRVDRSFRAGLPVLHYLEVAPDGRRFAEVGSDSCAIVRDVETGEELFRVESPPGSAALFVGKFAPDGTTFAVAGNGANIHVCDAMTGGIVWQFDAGESFYQNVAFSPDGRQLAACRGHAIKLWDVASGKEIAPTPGLVQEISHLTFSPDGSQIAMQTWGSFSRRSNVVELWSISDGSRKWRSQHSLGPLNYLGFDVDGGLACVGGFLDVRYLNYRSGDSVSTWTLRREAYPFLDVFLGSPGGRVVFGWRNGDLRLREPNSPVFVFDGRTGEEMLRFEADVMTCNHAAVSPDGRSLALGGSDLRLLDLATGEEWYRADVRGAGILDLVFSDDGRTLAATCSDRSLRLFEVSTGQQRHAFQPYADVRWMYFVLSPDGRSVATWEHDNIVTLWRLGSERELLRLPSRQGRMTAAAFSADGKRLATAGSDTTVLIWDIADLVRGP